MLRRVDVNVFMDRIRYISEVDDLAIAVDKVCVRFGGRTGVGNDLIGELSDLRDRVYQMREKIVTRVVEQLDRGE